MYRLALLLLIVAMAAGGARAHDASSYGGVFRSRNLGGTWLRADVGLFLNAALVVAVDPQNGSHLLAGTDLGLLASRNGGLTWTPEAADLIFGAVFAVTFLDDGERRDLRRAKRRIPLRSGPMEAGAAPEAAVPARSSQPAPRPIASICSAEIDCSPAVTVGGRLSEVPGASETSAMTALAIVRSGAEIIVAVIDGRGHDQRGWRPAVATGRAGNGGQPVDTVVADPQVREECGRHGRPGLCSATNWARRGARSDAPCPSPPRQYAELPRMPRRTILVVSTNRGLYRSENGGETWMLKEDNLPIHLEAGPLARDPAMLACSTPYTRSMPYSEVWRIAIEAGNLCRDSIPSSLAGGHRVLVCWLSLAGGWLGTRLLVRSRLAATDGRR